MGSYLGNEFTPMAHRGGALLPDNHGIENTLKAFRNAHALGFRYLETDVHATADGHLVAFHDENLARVAEVDAHIADLPLADVRQILVGGREPIPTLDELFETFPEARFNLDIKAPGATVPLARSIERHGLQADVCVGSFSSKRLATFRRLLPQVTTSIAPPGVAMLGLGRVIRANTRAPRVYQVPLSHRIAGIPMRIVTAARVRAIHAAGLKVHVWTIDDPVQMHELIDWGVDGIITDRPDQLKRVLHDRGMWSTRGWNG